MQNPQDIGLPSLVVDLLYQQAKMKDLQVDYNINKRGDIMKLTISWTPAAIHSQPHSIPKPSQQSLKGYRRKNPSELSRDKRRMDDFISKKRQAGPQNQTRYSLDNMLSPIVDNGKQNGKSSQVTGVRTRQQAKSSSSIELPRHVEENDFSLFDKEVSYTENVQEESSVSLVTVHSVNSESHEDQTLHSAQYSTPGPLTVPELEQGHSDLYAESNNGDDTCSDSINSESEDDGSGGNLMEIFSSRMEEMDNIIADMSNKVKEMVEKNTSDSESDANG